MKVFLIFALMNFGKIHGAYKVTSSSVQAVHGEACALGDSIPLCWEEWGSSAAVPHKNNLPEAIRPPSPPAFPPSTLIRPPLKIRARSLKPRLPQAWEEKENLWNF